MKNKLKVIGSTLAIAAMVGLPLLAPLAQAQALTNDQITASSTAIVDTGIGYLVASLFAFMPLILKVAIPVGLLIGAYFWVRHRAVA